MTKRHDWKDQGACRGQDVDNFFDNYENDDPDLDYPLRRQIDSLCIGCPVVRTCFAVAKFQKESGVWGGVYMIDGAHNNNEFNDHKSQDDWVQTYMALTK